jgi:hypothetical protein
MIDIKPGQALLAVYDKIDDEAHVCGACCLRHTVTPPTSCSGASGCYVPPYRHYKLINVAEALKLLETSEGFVMLADGDKENQTEAINALNDAMVELKGEANG